MSVLPQPQVEVLSEEEGEEEDEEEDILSLAEEKYRPAALDKMIALIALLVEQSRSERYELDVLRRTRDASRAHTVSSVSPDT